MMTRKRFPILGCVAVAVVAFGACSGKDRGMEGPSIDRTANSTETRISQLLLESPHEYLAAVQEVVDDSQCYGPKDGSSCPLLVKVVDFIAGEPGRSAERQLGWVYRTMEMRMEQPWPNRRIGRRRLVLAFPVKAGAGWYGNRVFILDPTPEEVERLREIMSRPEGDVGGRLSNTRLNPPVRPVTRVACATRAPGQPAG
jgi:hypothetical protein